MASSLIELFGDNVNRTWARLEAIVILSAGIAILFFAGQLFSDVLNFVQAILLVPESAIGGRAIYLYMILTPLLAFVVFYLFRSAYHLIGTGYDRIKAEFILASESQSKFKRGR